MVLCEKREAVLLPWLNLEDVWYRVNGSNLLFNDGKRILESSTCFARSASFNFYNDSEQFANGISSATTFPSISLHTEPLLLRVDEARDRKPSSLSIARPSKFVQLSLARTRKSSFFKVHDSDFSFLKLWFDCIIEKTSNTIHKRFENVNWWFIKSNFHVILIQYFICMFEIPKAHKF